MVTRCHVRSSGTQYSDAADAVRRLADVLVSGALLVVFLIPMALIAIAVHLEDSGPALFRQERVGLRGSRFTLLKFRTMFQGGDDRAHRDLIARELRGEDTVENGSSKLSNDRRVTRVGAFLRKTSLDELPQLFNVLRGEMSLVGPRPCLSYEVEKFQPYHYDRFLVPAGLTGLWQVSARAHSTFAEALDLDVLYAQSWSIGLDLSLLARTPLQLLRA